MNSIARYGITIMISKVDTIKMSSNIDFNLWFGMKRIELFS